MGTFTVGSVHLNRGVLVVDRVVISALDAEGVVELDLATSTSGFHLFFDGNFDISGIRLLDNGSLLSLDSYSEVMITCSSSGTSSFINEDVGVTETTERIRTSGGLQTFFDDRRIQLFWSTAGGARRWECPDWSV